MNQRNKNKIQKDVSILLTCIGSIGVVVTSVLAVKATPKALELIESAEKKSDEPLSEWEKVKATIPVYVPSIVSATTTIACIFSAQILNRNQQAAIMSAYAFLEQSCKRYRNKVVEIYGKEVHDNIIQSIAAEDAEPRYIHAFNMLDDCTQFLEEDYGEPILFYDEFGHRYFNATLEQVLQAEYHVNRNYALNGGVYLNEFYEFLGIEKTDIGDQVGWMVNDDCIYWLDFNHRKIVLDDGLECYAIEMITEPTIEIQESY